MKIVFLHTDFRVYWLPRLKYLGDFLQSHGHELHIIEIAGNGSPYAFSDARLEHGIYQWHCLFPDQGMEHISSDEACKRSMDILERLKPDIVFAGAIAYPSGASAVKFCRKNRIPVVIFDNARLADVPRSKIVNWIKRKIYENVDAVLIPAPSHLMDFQFWGFNENQVYYGANVVDNQYWEALSHDIGVLRQFKLPEKYFLGVGRQIPKKNWYNLLVAYKKTDCKTELVLVGNGTERPKLEQFIKENQCNGRVHLLDFQKPEVLAPLYRQAKALILPSFGGETWGLTVNEAMSCGTPVLVSNLCGCCETLCINGKTGFSFSPEVDAIADALKKFEALSDEELCTMRNNAKDMIAQWGIERFAESVFRASRDLTKQTVKSYYSLISRIIVSLWKGRYRPV